MRILIHTEGTGAHHFQRLGLARALSAANHEVVMWNRAAKPVYDVFDEFDPEIFLGQTYNLDKATVKCILESNGIYVGLRASDNSPFADEVKSKGFNILTATEAEIKLTEELGPYFIHSYYDEERIGELHENWNNMGIKSVSNMLAADVFEYAGGKSNPKYECDIAFVGGYWAYKGQNLDRYLLPLCQDKYDYNVKIFGNQGWGVPQYCGWIADDQVKHLTASAKVCPNISEPHATEFGYDVNERIFKLLINKCLVVSDHVDSAVKLFVNHGVMFASTPKLFKELIDTCVADRSPSLDKEVKKKSQEAYEFVRDNHTYFNRCKDLFANFDLIEEIDKMDEAYQNTKKELNL